MTASPTVPEDRYLNPPFATADVPAMAGTIRERPEDFVVDEIPAYLPAGEGDHLFVHFEKRDLTTPVAVAQIAEAIGANPQEVGYAGLKDRRAVTRQWASFLFGDEARARALDLPGITILDAKRHRNKLRTGHLHGNRFSLLVRGAGERDLDTARAALDVLSRRGVPNYFGPQRFGHGASNVAAALAWLLGGDRAPRDRFRRKLLVSVLQSVVFNHVVAERVDRGLLDVPLEGDLLAKEDTGGLFIETDAEAARRRVSAAEVSPTGPMFGSRMRAPTGEALALEQAVLGAWNVTDEVVERMGRLGEGTRRPVRVLIGPVELALEPDGLRLQLELPRGSYATVVLRELLKRDVD